MSDKITNAEDPINVTIKTKEKLNIVPFTMHIGAEIRGTDLREKP